MNEKHSGQVSVNFIKHLLSAICHDVGAPTRHIVQFTQMLGGVGNNNEALDDKHKHWLSVIQDGGIQIQTMLKSLSIFSRLSMYTDESSNINLHILLDKILTYHRNNTVVGDKKIDVTINGVWPDIVGNEEHWRTLFSEIIENALIFQPQDPDHVIRLIIGCEFTQSELTFLVADNGIGASEHQRNNMTRPFKRLNNKTDYPGMGMGLAYCEYIAELNNARLNISRSDIGGISVSYTQKVSQAE